MTRTLAVPLTVRISRAVVLAADHLPIHIGRFKCIEIHEGEVPNTSTGQGESLGSSNAASPEYQDPGITEALLLGG